MRVIPCPPGNRYPHDPSASVLLFGQQIIDRLLPEIEILLLLDLPFHELLIRFFVGLRPRAMHGRAFATIEQAKLDARRVDRLAHDAAERIHLANDLPLGNTPDGRIATHLSHGVEIGGQQTAAGTESRCRQRRFGPGVPRTDDQHIVLVMGSCHGIAKLLGNSGRDTPCAACGSSTPHSKGNCKKG